MEATGVKQYNLFLKGETAALEEIVALYCDRLIGFACSYSLDFLSAEDVVMDAFAMLLVKKPKLKNEAAFKTYLYRMVRNACIDRLRLEKRHTPLSYAEQLPDKESVEDIVFANENKEKLTLALKKIPPLYAEVIYLIYFEEFSIEDCQEVLHKNKKQIYNLLSRAKVALKQKLEM